MVLLFDQFVNVVFDKTFHFFFFYIYQVIENQFIKRIP